MANVSFSDISPVGNDLLDAQHKVIVGYMEKVRTVLLAGREAEEVFALVDRLDTYCKLHFLEEETVMAEMGFPDVVGHAAQHALFMTHLENFVARYNEENGTKNIDELSFLKNWFLEHIEHFDRKYAEYGKH